MPDTMLSFILTSLLAALSGGLLAILYSQRKVTYWREKAKLLEQELELQKQHNAERQQTLNEAKTEFNHVFNSLSAQALKHNNEEFLKLARESFQKLHIQSSGDFEKREKALEGLVNPIKEALNKTEQQIREMEKERKEAYGSLTKHIETMTEVQQALQGETRNLVQALRRPEVRGQWGEMTLKRLAELAGMVEYCDFYEQEQVRTENGALRPDMIVRMPGGREIVVDVKTPLDAYLNAVETTDEGERASQLQRHAGNIRKHFKDLSSKAYWSQFKNAPDFVVMFIPGEQFLTAALDVDRKIIEDALSQKVIISTPTSFVALLRAVAFGWRQEQLAENAEHIRAVGEELYGRLATFGEHLNKLGKSLGSGVEHFNKAVGSFDSRVLPSARKFTELGIQGNKEISGIEQLDKTAKNVETE